MEIEGAKDSSWIAPYQRELRRLWLFWGVMIITAILGAGFLVAILVWVLQGCSLNPSPSPEYYGCCAVGFTECKPANNKPFCCKLTIDETCSSVEGTTCQPPRSASSASTLMIICLALLIVCYLVFCVAWPLLVYTRQQRIHPIFVRIAQNIDNEFDTNELRTLTNEVVKNAALDIVGILPTQVRLVVDRTTQDPLHDPIRVVLPVLLWTWLSPQSQRIVDAWASNGKRLGRRSTARLIFLSAALNRADLLRTMVNARLLDGNLTVLNTECEIYFADLDPDVWRLGLLALLTAGVINLLAPLSSLFSPPDQYAQIMPPPLIVATVLGHYDVVVLLLDMQANVNLAYLGGLTALHYAAKYNFSEIAKVLIFAGASPEARNVLGATAIDMSATPETAVIMKAAIAAKRKVDQTTAKVVKMESKAIVPFKQLQLGESLSPNVIKGVFRGHSVLVTKRSFPGTVPLTLLNHIEALQALTAHEHLVAIEGIALDPPQDPILYVIQEYVEGDDLLDIVRQRAKRGQAVSIWVKRQLALQIIEAMTHLHFSGMMHRRLSARHVYVTRATTGTDLLAKLSLPIFVDDKLAEADLPWMAPEVLREEIITAASDVWSFGVLYWELLSDGKVPFEKAPNVRERILAGELLPRLPDVSMADHSIMQDCWLQDVDMRPNFKMLGRTFKQLQTPPDMPPNKAKRRLSSSAPSESTPLLSALDE